MGPVGGAKQLLSTLMTHAVRAQYDNRATDVEMTGWQTYTFYQLVQCRNDTEKTQTIEPLCG